MKNTLSKSIRFNHTAHQALLYKKAILKKISSVIDSGIFLNGPEARLLEQRLEDFFDGGYCTTVASGHDALQLALASLNITSRDEVIFPVNSVPTAFPVFLSGAQGVPTDVDENGQLDISAVEKKITKRTRAIIVVHLYGLVGDLGRLVALARKKNIRLIEDCAQAFGAAYRGRPVGTFGDIGCFSFYPTKNMGTLGDGGALWTNKKRLFDYLVKAKSYGAIRQYWSEFISGHSRLPEIQAGVLNIYMDFFNKDIQKREKLARYFSEKLSRSPYMRFIKPLETSSGSKPVQHLYVVRAHARNKLQEYLVKKKIETHIHYPCPIHLMPAFSFLKKRKGSFPQAEKLADAIISLPFHQYLSCQHIDYIVESISEFYRHHV